MRDRQRAFAWRKRIIEPSITANAARPWRSSIVLLLLLQAVLRAADELELSRAALARLLGKDRSTLSRAKGIDPSSKTG